MLWVYSPIQHAAIGVSPEDGHVLKRIALPADGTFGIGWYKGHLAFFDREPRCGEPPKQPDLLLLMDPATGTVTEEIRIKGSTFPICVGQVNDDLWATDAWQQSVHLARPDPKSLSDGGSWFKICGSRLAFSETPGRRFGFTDISV